MFNILNTLLQYNARFLRVPMNGLKIIMFTDVMLTLLRCRILSTHLFVECVLRTSLTISDSVKNY